MKLLKRILYLVFTLTMGVVMAISSPLTVFANGQKQYIESYVVATGKNYAEAKTQLDEMSKKDNKQYLPLNTEQSFHSDSSKYVLIGYTTTTDKDKAAGDVAIMNMNGGFDGSAKYDELLKRQKEEMKTTVEQMRGSIDLYAEKVEENDPLAVLSYDILNAYYDDDTVDPETGKAMGMGKLLTTVTDDDKLANIFLQVSGQTFAVIQQYIGLACVEDWVSYIEEYIDPSNYDESTDDAARKIAGLLPEFQENMNKFLDIGITLSASSEADIQNYLDNTTSVEDKAFFLTYCPMEDNMRRIVIPTGEDTSTTLFDVLMSDPDSVETRKALYPIAFCQSDEVLALVNCIGLEKLYSFSNQEESNINDVRTKMGVDSIQSVSVYFGVDRSLYKSEGIAVTSAAKRALEAENQSLAGSKSDDVDVGPYAAGIAVSVMLGIIFAIAAGQLEDKLVLVKGCASGLTKVELTQSASVNSMSFLAAKVEIGMWVCRVFAILAFVAMCVFIAIVIYYSIDHGDDDEGIRTEIPRVMVEDKTKEGEKLDLTYYYCALGADGKCADLNCGTGSQWNALYYTTNKKAGSPILAEGFTIFSSSKGHEKTDTFLPLHGFGSVSAYNLFSYDSTNNNKSTIYVGFSCENEEETNPDNGTATVFSNGINAIFAGGGAIVGAAVALGISSATRKKKAKVSEI